ncbi:MAG: hypothetical protein LUQ15_07790 [Methanothrix sp.]|nr:hypothetical protein [Methanothrix sp.]OYV08867.1 MAG: hypothetical protein CG437_1637 [Methanosaeta sp. NSP1]
MSLIVEARGLTKVYRRGREEIYALKDVDFAVKNAHAYCPGEHRASSALQP